MKIQLIKTYPFDVTQQQNVIQLSYTAFGGRKILDQLGIELQNYRSIRSLKLSMIILICYDERLNQSVDTLFVPENVLYNLHYPRQVQIQNIFPTFQLEQMDNYIMPTFPITKQLIILENQLNNEFISQLVTKGPFIIQLQQKYLIDLCWISKITKNASLKALMLLNREKTNVSHNNKQKQQKSYIIIRMQSKQKYQIFKPKQTKLKIQSSTLYQPTLYHSINISGLHKLIKQKQVYRQMWHKVHKNIGKNTIISLESQNGNGVSSFLHSMSYQNRLTYKKINLKYFWSIKSVYDCISNLYRSGADIVYVKNIKWIQQLIVNGISNGRSNMISTCLKKIQQCFYDSQKKTLKKCVLIINYSSEYQIKQQFNQNIDIQFKFTKQLKQQFGKIVLRDFISIPQMCDDSILQNIEFIIETSLQLGWARLYHIIEVFQRNKNYKSETNLKQQLEQLIKQLLKSANKQKEKNITKISWDDIGGLQTAKEQIIESILLPIKHPQIFDQWIKPRTGLLFYGPPGTGKTLLGKCIANQCKMGFISVKGPQLLNMYVGESQKNVREVFERASKNSPYALVPKRGNNSDSNQVMDRIVAELMTQMDRASQNRVFIIGATNRPDLLDPSILRAGRFDKQIYLGISKSPQERVKILQAQTRNIKLQQNFNYQKIVESLPPNLTGADFYGLTSKAIMNSMERILAKYQEDQFHQSLPNQIIILQEDFIKSGQNIVPSVTTQELKHYESLKNKYSAN